jgi:glycosaminoglycan attachment site
MKLFDVIVDKKELHPDFVRCQKDKYKVEVLEEWADDDLIYRDGNNKFVKEFQTTFNSALWELYCNQVLKKLECKIDLIHEAPDFIFELLEEHLLIECVVANNAKDKVPEYDILNRLNYHDMDEIVYEQVIRLSNAFYSKYRKYSASYSKKEWVINKPYIIAIAPFEQPNFMVTGNEAIRALLFGWRTLRDTGEEELVKGIFKNENTMLPLGLFKTKEYENVSGVLFSNVATAGKVQALSNCPYSTFGQIRYNLKFDRPLVRYDSRMKFRKFDEGCKMIKACVKEYEGMYKKYTIERPLLRWETNYKEDICDGLSLYVNPYAKNKISNEILDIFFDNGINIIEYNIQKDEDIARVHDLSLIQRHVITLEPGRIKIDFPQMFM